MPGSSPVAQKYSNVVPYFTFKSSRDLVDSADITAVINSFNPTNLTAVGPPPLSLSLSLSLS
jgi:hypothetical protein